jgi:hypothetical protein
MGKFALSDMCLIVCTLDQISRYGEKSVRMSWEHVSGMSMMRNARKILYRKCQSKGLT